MIKIEKKGYLGIDESNHGNFPEIVTGVYSYNDKDILTGTYSKKAKKHLELKDITSLLGPNRQYKHLIFTENFKKNFGEEGIKVIAATELILASPIPLQFAIYDGDLIHLHQRRIEDILRCRDIQLDLNFIRHADISYKIVNLADTIAYLLYTYYSQINQSSLIELNLKKYQEMGLEIC